MAVVDQNPTWLGKAESDRLEFKSADALKHPETIVRAVVGLLNHRGGHVVVGVNDQGLPEGKAALQHEKERLQNILVENIEPRAAQYVHVNPLVVSASDVLEIAVAPPRKKRPLYAERRHGLYGFWVRSGPTTRALTLSEARRLRPQETPQSAPPQRWDESLSKRGETEIVLVLQAELSESDGLDGDTLMRVLDLSRRDQLTRRDNGWTIVGRHDHAVPRPGRRIEIEAEGQRTWLSCNRTARTIRFEGRSSFLRWRAPDRIAEPVIYPFPLVEGVASFNWLLELYAREAEPHAPLHCQLGLWRPGGYRLGPYRPDSFEWQWPTRWTPPHDNTSVERTEEVEWTQLMENPDEVSHAFVAHVYEDFGYDSTAVPFWEEAEKRFVFPR